MTERTSKIGRSVFLAFSICGFGCFAKRNLYLPWLYISLLVLALGCRNVKNANESETTSGTETINFDSASETCECTQDARRCSGEDTVSGDDLLQCEDGCHWTIVDCDELCADSPNTSGKCESAPYKFGSQLTLCNCYPPDNTQ